MSQKKAFNPSKRRPGDPLHNGRYRAAALRRLKARWKLENPDGEWEPKREPVITPMLKAVEGGIRSALEALRSYNHDEAKEFCQFYFSLIGRDRMALTIEEIAFAQGIGTIRLSGLLAEAIVSSGHLQTQLLMGSSMHKVMKATVKAATDEVPIVADTIAGRVVVGKTNGDTRAMEMFHKMTGMMPIPKGSQIAIQNVYKGSEGKDEGESTPGGWRSPDERLREIYAVTEHKQLEAPKVDAPTITGHGSVEFEHARS